MTTGELLSALRKLNVRLRIEGDQLRCSAPKGTLTPTLRQALKEQKSAVIAFLRQAETALQSKLIPLVPIPRDQELELSYAQERLWFLQQLEPGSVSYNIAVGLELRGRLNEAGLAQSLAEIVRRHEVLRTRFATRLGKPVQVIEAAGLRMGVADLSGLSEEQREAEARRLAGEEAGRGFDLSEGPMLRVRLLRLGEEKQVVLVTMHHIVSDGWSMGVMAGELRQLYEAYASGGRSSLGELAIQYADYALWQRRWLSGDCLAMHLDYWKGQLQGELPEIVLPGVKSVTQPLNHCRAVLAVQMPQGLCEELKILSRRQCVTLHMTLLAAFQTLLHRYTGITDIVVGSPVANRNREEIEGLIGVFENMLVMRADMSGNPTFVELLHRVRDITLGAFGHHDLPFERLVEELHQERRLSHTPIIHIAFALQDAPIRSLEVAGFTLTQIPGPTDGSKLDLTLCLWDEKETLGGYVEYNAELYDKDTMIRLVSHLQVLLESIVAQPKARIADLPVLTDAEKQALLNKPGRQSDVRRRRR